MADGRGRPRITTRACSAIDAAEQRLGLAYRRNVTNDWRIARICNHFVTRAPRPRLELPTIKAAA